MGIRIVKAGVLTTVQDAGRLNFQANGFSVSGTMDQQAANLANLLVGNLANQAVLEYSIVGPTLVFTKAIIFAITGAISTSYLNGNEIENNKAYIASKNDRLEIGPMLSGRYGYLAVSGGIQVPPVMQSRSTSLKYHLGGFNGRALVEGDFVNVIEPFIRVPALEDRAIPVESFDQDVTIRVTAGPQSQYFNQDELDQFTSQTFWVSNDTDRMGMRLTGNTIETSGVPEMLSEATVMGQIQVPKNGDPIVLLADRQTSGGYPVIAVVASVDLSKLVQLNPNQSVHFKMISLTESQQLNRQMIDKREQLAAKFDAEANSGVDTRVVARRVARLFK
ncbi:biotin-dependent carboxyltransferase family protein [Paucilactobacillus nenjiangensis]|uniref:5-oxoprolinase subunit C family protein n=1 Tax=Paucilactobacillus nenjiangensis TaxID=1296540 RepID=UPI0028D3B1FF|nr:biotin-dependent carboxyltransferase family protein [Paucilactobacillus nenjiangensis]